MNQRLPLISLILNGVLAIAVIVLFVLHFDAHKSPSADIAATDSTQEAELTLDSLPDLGSNNGAIAFIDLEELTKKYKFYNDGKTNIENFFKNKQAMLMKKKAQFEENVMQYEQLAPNLTPAVREKREKDLNAERESLMELNEKLNIELQDKELNFEKEFLSKIDTYLKVLSKEKNYSYVFTYVKGNPATIVYAKDTLNISDQVIHALNEQYKKK
ncbi:OmpH family outer membrane protein [Cytophaga aurantiaca]|uniref:OmpH family outer membrane protein n=1 Tax=Cytophaga aurantiaca TaxID=29530 RepID=UPI000367AF26|nr:OmpH family outer membrane protein [Cytophaga aurantiaca]